MSSNRRIIADSVPRLSRLHIERRAERFLGKVVPEVLKRPLVTPLGRLLTHLHEQHDLHFGYKDLGVSEDGKKFLGTCRFGSPPCIIIDDSVRDTVREPFTIAHEMGYFGLHGKLRFEEAEDGVLVDTAVQLDPRTGRRKLRTAEEWVEWQANACASALLLPRRQVRNAVLIVQRELDVTRNRGLVHVDLSPHGLQLFRNQLTKLSAMFGVSKDVVEYRLEQLGLLSDHRGDGTRHVSELFRKAQ